METRTTCPYCGVGCGVMVQTSGSEITGVRGDPDHPANHGRLCTKGSTLHFTARPAIAQQTRLLQPMLRPRRGAEPQVIDWRTAIDVTSQRLADIWTQHGPDAIGVYVSGQLLTEDYYVFNKLVKGLLGSNHIDTNSRLCMSSAVAGYKTTLGADAPPCSYEDLNDAHTVLIAGSNMAWAHPILFRRLEDARRANPSQRWIVVDPRRTETAEQADLHLQLTPGSDVALFNGLLHVMLWEGLVDNRYIAQHTVGFEALRNRVRECTPAWTAKATGCREEDVVTAARWFAQSPASLSLYCQGLNQSSSGTDKNAALINLHLATGHIGKPGAGPFSLTGQPNAMGGREVGGLANLLSAHRDLANPVHRAEVAALWGLPDVPSQPGRTAVDMFAAAADGEVKALWIACTNPAQSLPDQPTVRRALQRAELVIVQEAYAHTATTAYADVLLPATTWGEKDGTVTNSERRISRVRPAVPAPGQARHDWTIARDVAQALALRIGPSALTPGQRVALFDFPTAESVWNEHRESTRGRDLDITGLSYALLDSLGPQQWPFPSGASEGRTRLYADGVFATDDGRARFADVQAKPVAEPRSAAYPFSLNTGRLRDQWHGMSRTGTVGRLFGHAAGPAVDLHPHDMQRLRIADGDLVTLRARRGQVVLPARATDSVAPTQAFLPMHWGAEFMTGRNAMGDEHHGGINELTTSACCPRSKQPELKHAAVQIERARLPWQLVARLWLPLTQALTVRQQVLQSLRDAGWGALAMATVLPFGREEDTPEDDGDEPRMGLLLRLAATAPPPATALDALRKQLRLETPDVLAYDDAGTAQQRYLRLGAVQRSDTTGKPTRSLDAYWLAGDISGCEVLDELLLHDHPVPAPAHRLLAPGALRARLGDVKAGSPQVCNCFNVKENQIREALGALQGSETERLQQLQQTLKCGTQCGSCLPALKTLVRQNPTTVTT